MNYERQSVTVEDGQKYEVRHVAGALVVEQDGDRIGEFRLPFGRVFASGQDVEVVGRVAHAWVKAYPVIPGQQLRWAVERLPALGTSPEYITEPAPSLRADDRPGVREVELVPVGFFKSACVVDGRTVPCWGFSEPVYIDDSEAEEARRGSGLEKYIAAELGPACIGVTFYGRVGNSALVQVYALPTRG